jgi:hypothetical protein
VVTCAIALLNTNGCRLDGCCRRKRNHRFGLGTSIGAVRSTDVKGCERTASATVVVVMSPVVAGAAPGCGMPFSAPGFTPSYVRWGWCLHAERDGHD